MFRSFPIITISREFGSGGHSIGLALAERLGLPFYDKAIVTEAAEKSGYSEEFVAHQGEHLKPSERLLSRFLHSNAPGYADPQDVLFEIQRTIILERAQSPCVIVGRAADHILREAGIPALNVFIYAGDSFRTARVLARYGERDTDILSRLREKDQARAAFYQRYTGQRWGLAKNYDVCLNSGVLGVGTCVSILVDILREEDQRAQTAHDA